MSDAIRLWISLTLCFRSPGLCFSPRPTPSSCSNARALSSCSLAYDLSDEMVACGSADRTPSTPTVTCWVPETPGARVEGGGARGCDAIVRHVGLAGSPIAKCGGGRLGSGIGRPSGPM